LDIKRGYQQLFGPVENGKQLSQRRLPGLHIVFLLATTKKRFTRDIEYKQPLEVS
jgi:hypothetical protein